MPRTSPTSALETVMLDLRDADQNLSAGITRTERAARTAYDADTLILLRHALRSLRQARTLCASIHPNGIPGWRPAPAQPEEE